jgi:histidinol dehydrogenase
MKTAIWNELDARARVDLLRRPTEAVQPDVVASVLRVIEQVRADGDVALRALTRRFDQVEIGVFEVGDDEFADARALVAPELQAAMAEARQRLIAWHRAGMSAAFDIETAPGVRCGRILRGIGRVGLYVPAGSAPLPSTALMLGVPAALAECGEVVLCTPPQADGRADPIVLMAAKLCGISRVFKLGGAQAIAAMAFGTESIPACDKLFGPGNAFVTAAKQQVAMMAGGAAMDLPAGPSEVLVIADGGASAEYVASDLLSQAEHGADSQVILVADSAGLIDAVQVEIEAQLQALPRVDIARRALEHARLILVEDMDDAFVISNDYAPEHLILAMREPAVWLPKVQRAGSVFLGDYAPESLGDYCSGTNHVLPTNGAARAYSGVSVASFQTSISIQSVSREGLALIGPCAVTLARAEGLEAHAQAVLLRTGGPL